MYDRGSPYWSVLMIVSSPNSKNLLEISESRNGYHIWISGKIVPKDKGSTGFSKSKGMQDVM